MCFFNFIMFKAISFSRTEISTYITKAIFVPKSQPKLLFYVCNVLNRIDINMVGFTARIKILSSWYLNWNLPKPRHRISRLRCTGYYVKWYVQCMFLSSLIYLKGTFCILYVLKHKHKRKCCFVCLFLFLQNFL